MNSEIMVDLGQRSYPIYFRRDARDELAERILGMASTGRAVLITDTTVGPLYAQPLADVLRERGLKVALLDFPAGESHKNLDTVRRIYERCLQFGVDRETPIISCGGGVVGDVAGFVAATLLRGLPFVQIPTTVLSQVDSSVGGKVGVNLAEGKNLIGAFHQPSWVFVDPTYLSTLPLEERRAGLAEAAKHAILSDRDLLNSIREQASGLLDADPDSLLSLLPQIVAIKAGIVSQDERESGVRTHLNLGHTLGHAFEADCGYRGLRHGEAVALGIRASLELSRIYLGLPLSAERVIGDTLDALGLPTDWTARMRPSVLDRVDLDKKNLGSCVRMVLLRDVGLPVVQSIPRAEFRERMMALAASGRSAEDL